MSDDHSKHDDCAFPDEPCNQLTFAEAMAIAGQNKPVEVRDGGAWRPVMGSDCVGFLSDPGVKFRRPPTRPRRMPFQLPQTLAGRLEFVDWMMHYPVFDDEGNDTGETCQLISTELAKKLTEGL